MQVCLMVQKSRLHLEDVDPGGSHVPRQRQIGIEIRVGEREAEWDRRARRAAQQVVDRHPKGLSRRVEQCHF
jgi:hypothetical protein